MAVSYVQTVSCWQTLSNYVPLERERKFDPHMKQGIEIWFSVVLIFIILLQTANAKIEVDSIGF
jgi:hypothetical protein